MLLKSRKLHRIATEFCHPVHLKRQRPVIDSRAKRSEMPAFLCKALFASATILSLRPLFLAIQEK